MKTKSGTTGKKICKRYTPAERRSLVRRYQKSGLSQAAFCRKNNIVATTFTNWVRRCAKKMDVGAKFAEIEISAPALAGASAEIVYPDGKVLRLRDLQITEESAAFIRKVISC
jgi:transposase-like protein